MYLLAEIRKCITYEIEIEGEGRSNTMCLEYCGFVLITKMRTIQWYSIFCCVFVCWMYYSLQLNTCFATNRSKIKERKSEANLKRWKENTSAASTDPHILTDDKGCGYFKLNFVKQWTMNWFNKIWEKTHNTLMFGLTLHSIM